MQRAGHLPLWQAQLGDTRQVLRFVFTEGHGSFYRVVTITERADGSGELVVAGSRPRTSARSAERALPTRRTQLNPGDLVRLTALGEAAGAWKFENGTWDVLGGDEIYMHCQVLEMERATPAGYRYSSVNIGCNHPQKLMPLVNEIVRLAGLKTTEGGMLYS